MSGIEELAAKQAADRARRNGASPPGPDPLQADAFHGLAGEIVRTIEPHSEADPAALLMQFLAAVGNAAGRSAGFRAEADFHPTILDVLLVGPTAKGRKGSSWGQASSPLKMADPTWEAQIASGLSSGEGLIHAVRDPRTERKRAKTKADREQADADGYVTEIVDEGVADKRLMVVETEFASALRVMGRDGSTLSAVIRDAWDGKVLRTMTKHSPTKATDAHVSIVGHVVQEELARELSATDAASGFGNRFLYACVRRSKLLPEGGDLDGVDWRPLVDELRHSLQAAGVVGEMRRDAEARELWAKVYPGLSEGKPGLFGAVTSRAEAQVMRLAVIYALLDCESAIRPVHLRAALAVWEFSEASARYVFGESLGDPIADALLRELRMRADGMTRTDMRDHFRRHKSSQEIGDALELLATRNLARPDEPERTGGRPTERWRALPAHTSLSAHPLENDADRESLSERDIDKRHKRPKVYVRP